MVKLLASITATALFAIIGSGDAFQSPAVSSILQRHVGGKIDTKTLLQSTIINGETPTEISTDDEPTIAADTDTQSSKTPEFNWFKAWHPIVPIEFLDNEKPHKFKLLGIWTSLFGMTGRLIQNLQNSNQGRIVPRVLRS